MQILLIFRDEFERYDSKRKYNGIRKTKSRKDCRKKIFYSLFGLFYTACKWFKDKSVILMHEEFVSYERWYKCILYYFSLR